MDDVKVDILDFCRESEFKIVHTEVVREETSAGFEQIDSLDLSKETREYIKRNYPYGLYKHQATALRYFCEGKNICLTTSTASGKSLGFYLSGIELLARNRGAKTMAIYPMLALSKEQKDRWTKTFEDTGLNVKVGRIDGKIKGDSHRLDILSKSSVVIFTPDIIHTWLLSHLNDKAVIDFLKNLELVIVDEVHTYTGVFGSNSAFLFRRIRHLLLSFFSKKAQFISASATLADTEKHLSKLFGINDFSIIDSALDTSPHHQVKIHLINPPRKKTFLTEVTDLISLISKDNTFRFIVFVDSRKQTEFLASILNKNEQKEEKKDENILEKLNILPFRSGYEEGDRLKIQERLTEGTLAGVISTSALELGMDIPHLNLGILLGVPNSATSLFQRIGRIGRCSLGCVLIINQGTVYDEFIFSTPAEIMKRPLAEGALYLENQRIQYIHALCLARSGGEHDTVYNIIFPEKEEQEFESAIDWPKGFIELCHSERLGEIRSELQSMKIEASDDPNHIFPLRDVETQFKVEQRLGSDHEAKGTLSYSQVMREAYPGAIYYYATQPLRVTQVNLRTHEILTKKEKHYNTSPSSLPPRILPDLTNGVFRSKRIGDIIIIECNLQVGEEIVGYSEQQGSKKVNFNYPLNKDIFYNQKYFSRNFFTTGIIISHPSFEDTSIKIEDICQIFFDAFLMIVPFEKRDIDCSVGKHRVKRPKFSIKENTKFISIYDKTYGSLRLTSRIFSTDLLRKTLEKTIEIRDLEEYAVLNDETKQVFDILYEDSKKSVSSFNSSDNSSETEEKRKTDENLVKILLPDSHGFTTLRNNQEVVIERVFFHHKNGLRYRVKYLDSMIPDDTEVQWPIDSITGVNGESTYGYYCLDTGEIIPGEDGL
jgi:DEAD/DEAH box helicase domain-containing protein